MDEPSAQPTRLLTPRRIIIEGLGSLVGLALLGWVIYTAVDQGDWSRVLDARPGLVALLVGCTIISTVLNGATFWVTIQPVKPLRFWDLQWLNMAGNLLNYAPVRLGGIARIMYHIRIDRLGILQITAWFGMIFYVLCLAVGSCLMATFIHPGIDAIWLALVLGQMLLGGLLTRVLVGHPVIVKHGRGVDRMLREHRSLWGAMALRLADVGAFSGRMYAALAILGIEPPGEQVIILALVAFTSNLIPFGRAGFREFCVAIVATRLATQGAEFSGDVSWSQLALIDSLGEVLIYVPGGAAAILWYRKKWTAAGALQAHAGSEERSDEDPG